MNKVKDLPRVQLGTSMKQGFGCGIGFLSVTGRPYGELDTFLLQHYKIHTVGINWEDIKGVRVTPNVYTTTKNLDLLVTAITDYVNSIKQ